MPNRELSADCVKQLYDRHGAALLAYARSFVADVAIAEDIIQQVFVKLLQGGISMPEAPLPYLYRAVRNAALNKRRNGRYETPLDAEGPWFVHRGGDRESALALQAALAQ